MNDVERAQKRLVEFINRSAGQHLRAMRKDAYVDGVASGYDAAESQAEAAANRQMEYDQAEFYRGQPAPVNAGATKE